MGSPLLTAEVAWVIGLVLGVLLLWDYSIGGPGSRIGARPRLSSYLSWVTSAVRGAPGWSSGFRHLLPPLGQEVSPYLPQSANEAPAATLGFVRSFRQIFGGPSTPPLCARTGVTSVGFLSVPMSSSRLCRE